MEGRIAGDERVTPSDRQRKAQRARSIAIALSLIAFVVVMYIVTIVKMGPEILDRAL